jgi:hypothetical protein
MSTPVSLGGHFAVLGQARPSHDFTKVSSLPVIEGIGPLFALKASARGQTKQLILKELREIGI